MKKNQTPEIKIQEEPISYPIPNIELVYSIQMFSL